VIVAAWWAVTRIEVGVRDLVQRTGDSQAQVGYSVAKSDDVVCGLHRAQGDEVHGFLRLASKPRSMVSLGLASKPVATICQWFGLKTTGMGFSISTSKPTATVW
jgi:hypothetical protein